MMGPTVDPFNDRIGYSFQLVLKAALYQPSDDMEGGLVAVQGEAADAMRRTDGFDEAEAFEFASSADDQAAEFLILLRGTRLQVDESGAPHQRCCEAPGRG